MNTNLHESKAYSQLEVGIRDYLYEVHSASFGAACWAGCGSVVVTALPIRYSFQ
ncbi:MAG: hypothetical protein ACI8Z5_000757 [Lentimonas sp.]|jgi:hypothetical protein